MMRLNWASPFWLRSELRPKKRPTRIVRNSKVARLVLEQEQGVLAGKDTFIQKLSNHGHSCPPAPAREMPRQVRIEFESAVYHVMCRGDRREAIFEDDSGQYKGTRPYG